MIFAEDLLKGLRCETCYPRAFGEMVDDSVRNSSEVRNG